MAEIIPFKGLRYNEELVGDISNVVTPPYDVISSKEQDNYYNISEYNCIRLELSKEMAGDDDSNNKYTRAAQTLQEWIDNRVLVEEEKPCIYIYQQDFSLSSTEHYTRTGFIALVRLEEFSKGVILPHENTLAKPKEDRLKLMRACGANFSQIFSLYDDKNKDISKILKQYCSNNDPVISLEKGIAGSQERVWAISDVDIIDKIRKIMADKKLFIADGHHRYETALAYRNELKEKNPNHTGNELYNYVMMMLVDMDDPGLVVLPTHRMVSNIDNFDEKEFLQKASINFNIEKYETNGLSFEKLCEKIKFILEDGGLHTFVYYGNEKDVVYRLQLKDPNVMEKFHSDRHASYRDLDVAILHTLLLENILGIGAKQLTNQENLTYTHSIDEGVKEVQEGRQQMAFFMLPTTVKQIQAVSYAGEKMPQKSTYFYPKLLTGLVFNKFV